MEQKYISVYALNKYLKAKIEQDISLQKIYIKGEISNYRPHPSGHLYFTLKDEKSKVNAIMFASLAGKLNFPIENGMQVFICAKVSIYEATGQYQLYVQTMQPDGIGQLYLKYETLKSKLYKEGLFDEKWKKKIPVFPKNIAVLSAKQGAALQDIIRTISLRFPFTQVIVFPIPVQGQHAYLTIIETLKKVDSLGFDTIILARGGGSIEDLWNFNEEDLVRCIFGCQTPIITGIGHETDFTLSDFVSDHRSATPTAAATQATPDQNELRRHLNDLHKRLFHKMRYTLNIYQQNLKRLSSSYYLLNPEAIYSHEIFKLAQLQDRLFHYFEIFYMKNKQELDQFVFSLNHVMNQELQQKKLNLENSILKLDSLSPLKIMHRGYTLIQKDSQMIKSVNELKENDIIDIHFHDGNKKAIIK